MRKKEPPLRNLIKQRLERLDRSIGWLSRETGVDRVHLGRIIKRQHNPNLRTAIRIAVALKMIVDDLWILETSQWGHF